VTGLWGRQGNNREGGEFPSLLLTGKYFYKRTRPGTNVNIPVRGISMKICTLYLFFTRNLIDRVLGLKSCLLWVILGVKGQYGQS
jgi:hypothetical protein